MIDKWLKFKLGIIVLGILYLSLFFFVPQIFLPSYNSYKIACIEPELINEKIESGEVAGFINIDTGEIKIFVDEDSELFDVTLRHEMCHKFFLDKNIESDCFPPFRIGEEMICYIYEKL